MVKSLDEMSSSERVAEICAIIATGIIRLKSKNVRKSNAQRAISLDFFANQSVYERATYKTGKTI